MSEADTIIRTVCPGPATAMSAFELDETLHLLHGAELVFLMQDARDEHATIKAKRDELYAAKQARVNADIDRLGRIAS